MEDKQDDVVQQQITPEQIFELMHQQIAMELLGLAGAFGIDAPEAHIAKVVDFLVREQQMIAEKILPSMTDEAEAARAPIIGVRVWYQSKKSEMVSPMTRKRPEAAGEDPRAMFDFAAVMGFLYSPAVRGLLALSGFRWELFQAKGDEKPKIIV